MLVLRHFALPRHQSIAASGTEAWPWTRGGVYGVRRGEPWAWVGAVTAPVLGLAVALPAHYLNSFDTLGHLGLIYLTVVIFVAGAQGREGDSPDERYRSQER
jgi:hypothetical protein